MSVHRLDHGCGSCCGVCVTRQCAPSIHRNIAWCAAPRLGGAFDSGARGPRRNRVSLRPNTWYGTRVTDGIGNSDATSDEASMGGRTL
eukprot:7366766-Prymnesium_polylepis.2